VRQRTGKAAYVVVCGVVLALAFSACAGQATTAPASTSAGPSSGGPETAPASATAGAATEWPQTFKGTTLNFIGEATTQTDVLKTLVSDFTDKTGITVNVEEAPYDNVVQKLTLDFSTHKAAYDVFSMPYEYLGSFVEQKYIVPIDKYLKDPAFAVPGFDQSAIVPALWKAASNWKDQVYGMPSESPVMMMFYRKDLFSDPTEQANFKAKYGYDLAPAKTWTQFRDIGEFFTRKKGDKLAGQVLGSDFYGIATAAKRHVATVCEWFNYMWSYGGDLFDQQGNLAINSPANLSALTYWTGLTKFAPPGYTSYTWDEVTSAFQQSTVAESITWGDTGGAVEDPKQSQVSGKMGYASIPVDSTLNKTVAHFGGWTYAMNADSPNQDAAALFMEWALSKDIQTKLAQGGGLPAITPVFEDPALVASKPYWSQTLKSLNESSSRPRIPQWGGIANTLGLVLSQTLANQITPEQGLKAADTGLQQVMKDALPVTYQ
jgi:multiple sugar transport system substrate-binding protein